MQIQGPLYEHDIGVSADYADSGQNQIKATKTVPPPPTD